MHIQILEEHGHDSALLGMSLSFYDHAIPLNEFWTEEKQQRAYKRACKLAHLPGNSGEGKFLESIQVWLFIQASRGWWQEFDTYRVGMTKQSSSTMHTLDKRSVTTADFEVGTNKSIIEAFNRALTNYRLEGSVFYKDITRLKLNLPEGWLQERIVCTNYKVLQNIYNQRKKHRLQHWKQFCEFLLANLKHPEFITDELA